MERTEDMTRASGPATTLDGSYIDWAAVAGGGVVAVAVGSVFVGFGAAVGLSVIPAVPGDGSFNIMVIVSAVWIVLTLVSSHAAGGYIAGRMRRRVDRVDVEEVTARDGINGLVVWGLGIVMSVILLGTAVSLAVSTAASVAGSAATTTGPVAGGMAQGALSAAGALMQNAVPEQPTGYASSSLLRPALAGTGTAGDPGETAAATAAILGNVASTGEVSDAERTYLVSAVVARAGASQPEAASRVDAAILAVQTARTNALKQAADLQAEADRLAQDGIDAAIAAAEAARVSAILKAFLLAAAALVAAAASYVAAVRGGRHRDDGRIFGGFAYRG